MSIYITIDNNLRSKLVSMLDCRLRDSLSVGTATLIKKRIVMNTIKPPVKAGGIYLNAFKRGSSIFLTVAIVIYFAVVVVIVEELGQGEIDYF